MKLVLVQPRQPASGRTLGEAIEETLGAAELSLEASDVLLLPEHVRERSRREAYLAQLSALAAKHRCHVVGGSYHEEREGHAVNAGAVVGPDGEVVASYEKLRPYAREREHVVPGSELGMLRIAGRDLLVLICADFWFMDLVFRAPRAPDAILVPAFSVTRKPTPDYSRSLWRHLSIARAYELGVYVGVSDWAHAPGGAFATCGVAGFADPTAVDPERFFTAVSASGVAVHELDFDALDTFRSDRVARGFFWQDGARGPEAP